MTYYFAVCVILYIHYIILYAKENCVKKTILFLLFLSAIFSSIYADEGLYTLKKINYDIKGRSKPFFLENKLKYHEGMTFNSEDEVKQFTDDLRQDLLNLRYYEEIIVSSDVEGNDVILNIFLDDAWGLIPFGMPKFDSETGARMSLKLFWFNSLGTLTDTTFSGGFNVGRNQLTEEFELQTWDAGVSVSDIYLFDRYFDFSFKHALERASKDEKKWSLYNTSMSVGTTFYPYQDLAYSPSISISTKYGYEPVEKTIEDKDIIKNPFTVSYSHGLGRSNINWIGNFRDGYSYGIGNSLSLIIKDDELRPTTSFSINGKYFKVMPNLPLAVATKLVGEVSINDEMLGLGSNVRGVTSGDLYGNWGLYMNNNLYVSVIKLKGVAEAIWGPFLDIGRTDNHDFKYGAGADFILYVDKLKSMVARGTIGWDLSKDISLGNAQITITSSLFF